MHVVIHIVEVIVLLSLLGFGALLWQRDRGGRR